MGAEPTCKAIGTKRGGIISLLRRRERGTSVVEIVTVLGIVAISLSASLFNIRAAAAREEIDGWVRSITFELASAQQLAIATRGTVTATFVNQSYSITVSGGGTFREDTVPSHITFGATPRTVSFYRRGVPSGALSLPVSSTLAGRSYTITVEAGTGVVSFREP